MKSGTSEASIPLGLALVGYRGVGKSTVGRIVADRTAREFIDFDDVFEQRHGPILSYFETNGEQSFRARETEILREIVHARAGCVLATGGGAILTAANRDTLRRLGCVVYLTGSANILAERLRNDARTRPALSPAGTLNEIEQILAARAPLYESVADVVIDAASRSPEDVAAAVIGAWELWERKRS